MGFSSQEYWMGSLFLLKGIFPAQGWNPGLPHCKRILYQLSHKGSSVKLKCLCLAHKEGDYLTVLTCEKKLTYPFQRLPSWLSGQEPGRQCRRCRFDPWVGKIPWRRKWLPSPVFLPGKYYGQRSLAGTVHGVAQEPDMT